MFDRKEFIFLRERKCELPSKVLATLKNRQKNSGSTSQSDVEYEDWLGPGYGTKVWKIGVS